MPPVELVRAADDRARLAHVLSGLLGVERFPDAFPREVIEMRLEDVLRGGNECETADGAFRELIKERLDGVAARSPLTREQAQCRRAP